MRRQHLLVCALLLLPGSLLASTITVDFEGLPDSTFLTTQYSGLTFINAQILTAGISLNELEFPPHSGVNVASDFSGPMSILFATPVTSVSGFFTYAAPLTLNAYNSSAVLVGTTSSAFSTNAALSGDPGSSPNELLQLNFAAGISELTITGLASGASFVLDDLTYSTGVITGNAPEPSTLGLAACVSLALLTWKARQARSGRS